jgi:hypothetical protein
LRASCSSPSGCSLLRGEIAVSRRRNRSEKYFAAMRQFDLVVEGDAHRSPIAQSSRHGRTLVLRGLALRTKQTRIHRRMQRALGWPDAVARPPHDPTRLATALAILEPAAPSWWRSVSPHGTRFSLIPVSAGLHGLLLAATPTGT